MSTTVVVVAALVIAMNAIAEPAFAEHLNRPMAQQNCNSAIPVCQSVFVQPESFYGDGGKQEAFPTCLLGGESNSVWYTFRTSSSGTLFFSLETQNDYDFALYDITDGGCPGLPGSKPIRCNFSHKSGTTGLGPPAMPAKPALSYNHNKPKMMPGVIALAGHSYVLLVNNYSSDSSGYKLSFSGSASIADTILPKLTWAAWHPVDCSIIVTLSEPIRCDSIAPDGSDFKIIGPGGVQIIGASGSDCGAMSTSVLLTYQLTQNDTCGGTWVVDTKVGTDGNTLLDNCGNALPVGSEFTLASPPVPAAVLNVMQPAYCAGTAFVADGSPSMNEKMHFWSIVESDSNWNVIGPECSRWFVGQAGPRNVELLAAELGCILECGRHYRLKLAVKGCCSNWRETVVLFKYNCPPPKPFAGPDLTRCCAFPATLAIGAPGSPSLTYSWFPTTGVADSASPQTTVSTSVLGNSSAVYTLFAKNSEGCVASDAMVISNLCPSPSYFLPAAFSPNGDGRNDRWNVIDQANPTGPAYAFATSYHFQVYSRWGNALRTKVTVQPSGFANRTIPDWDGRKDNGKVLGTGVYTYELSIISCDSIEHRSGEIHLVK